MHEGVKFPCDKCNFKATQKANLLTHIKSIHEGVKLVYPIKPQPKNTLSYLTSRVLPKNTQSIVPHEVNANLEIG